MSSISNQGIGGVFRISGRKNIHNHGTYCPFWNENMVRYALTENIPQEQTTCSNSQEEIDEVDSNVMSKFVRASSPITIRKNDKYHRKSSKSSKSFQENYTDDDSDDYILLLSKSSPAILSSYSCCSEELEGANSISYSNASTSSSLSHDTLNNRSTISEQTTPLQFCQTSNNVNFNKRQTRTKNGILFNKVTSIILTVSMSIFVAILYNLFSSSKEVNSVIYYGKLHYYNDINGVGSKYKIDENSILQVRAGISTIFERRDTGSFIFSYNSDKKNFNSVNFNNFIHEIASTTARYLRNDSKIIRHVVVDTSNLKVQTDKEFMNEYLEDVDKSGVMLVKNLERIPSAVAMAFHYYCDEYNPLVKKSAIIFTLNVAKCSNVSSNKYSHENIEKCLADKWEDIPQDKIRPLLNRVVNVVIDVTSDF